MHEQKQGFLLVLDGERERRRDRLVRERGDGRIDGRDEIVVVGASNRSRWMATSSKW